MIVFMRFSCWMCVNLWSFLVVWVIFMVCGCCCWFSLVCVWFMSLMWCGLLLLFVVLVCVWCRLVCCCVRLVLCRWLILLVVCCVGVWRCCFLSRVIVDFCDYCGWSRVWFVRDWFGYFDLVVFLK